MGSAQLRIVAPLCAVVLEVHGQPAIVQENCIMAVDLIAASRRPLERLLHKCPSREWENIALFVDGGSTEALRWAGGMGFVLEELGISQVLDLQVGALCDWFMFSD